MELNRENIIKALECWASGNPCEGSCCPLFEISPDTCDRWIGRNALSLIKELTEENDYWKQQAFKGCMDKGQMDYEIRRLTEENERLSGKVAEYEEERKYHFEMSRKRIAEAKADTVQKMQELIFDRLDISVEGYSAEEVKSDVRDMVYQTAKEMVEGIE